MSGNDASAHEQIQIAVIIDIRQGQRPRAGTDAENALAAGVALQVKHPHCAAIGSAIFVIGRTDEQGFEAKHGRLIARGGAIHGSIGDGRKSAVAVVVVNAEMSAFAAGDDQIIPAIPIEIVPANARSELAEAIGQERLALEIVEGVFVMGVGQEVAHVLEERGSGRAWERGSVGAWKRGSVGAWERGSVERGAARVYLRTLTLQRSNALTL